ncbi:MAG: hypothetical protein ACXAC7_04625 [Candidatus Hodarchaeales archaeon]|jgi:hypothetical protein
MIRSKKFVSEFLLIALLFNFLILINPLSINNNIVSSDALPESISSSSNFSYTNSTLLDLFQGNDSCEFSFIDTPFIEMIDYTDDGLLDSLLFSQKINVTFPGLLTYDDDDLNITFFNDSSTYFSPGFPTGDTIIHFLPSTGFYNISFPVFGSDINATPVLNPTSGEFEYYNFVNVTWGLKLTSILFNDSSGWMGAEQSQFKTVTINNLNQWDLSFSIDSSTSISPIQNELKQLNGVNRTIGSQYSWNKTNINNDNIWFQYFDMTTNSLNDTFILVNETINFNGTSSTPLIRPQGVGFGDSIFLPTFFIPKDASNDLILAYMIEKALISLTIALAFNSSFEIDFWETNNFLFLNFTASKSFYFLGSYNEWNNSYFLVYSKSEGVLVNHSMILTIGSSILIYETQLNEPKLEIPSIPEIIPNFFVIIVLIGIVAISKRKKKQFKTKKLN